MNNCISKYFGITQDPNSQDIMIIIPYYNLGDLVHYITKDFYNKSWYEKLENLRKIITGLKNIHSVNIVHRDLHSGNIFFSSNYYPVAQLKNWSTYNVVIGDLGISKSATDSADDNENYGIILIWLQRFF